MMIEQPVVGQYWDFELSRADMSDGIGPTKIASASVTLADGTVLAATITGKVYVGRTLVLTPTVLYNSTLGRWYMRFALPKAGPTLVRFDFDVGGYKGRREVGFVTQQGLP